MYLQYIHGIRSHKKIENRIAQHAAKSALESINQRIYTLYK